MDGGGRDLITELKFNGTSFDDQRQIANLLNDFFISAPKEISDSIDSPIPTDQPTDLPESPLRFSLSDSPVTQTEIIDAVAQLESKKSEDLFGISMFFIKKFVSILVNPLYYIISKSFETGKFPNQLKIAKVVPIYKGGDKTSPDNYRPISLLPNFSKIFEKVMCNRLTFYLESNNLICNEQFGFRKGHSTLHPLVHFLNHVSVANNQSKYTIAIFCDLRKAFDTVNHKILINKMRKLGITGIELDWFVDYLTSRKQFVSLNNVNSNLLSILMGVPQGSILGPLLFLIYINDLPKNNLLKNSLFADDTTLLDSDSNLDNLVQKINVEFHKVINYFKLNKMALHPEKTKFILFSNRRWTPLPNVVFNFNPIDSPHENPNLISPMLCVNGLQNPSIRFLGVLIDPQLNFKEHISKLNKKLATGLFYLRSVRYLLDQKALKFIYFALIHSHLIYAIHIWSNTNESFLKSLFIKQKQAIRIITNSKYNSHTEPQFKELNILPLPTLALFFKLQFMQQFSNGFLPISFNNTWVTNRIRRDGQDHVELGNDDDIAIPFSRNVTISRMPLFSFPKLWADFPSEQIKFIRNKLEFNFELKKHFITLLSDTPNCNRLFCPSCTVPLLN